MDRVLSEQQKIMAVPRRYTSMVRDIWELQGRLERKRTPKHAAQLFGLAKFRAGYDFLLLRATVADPRIVELANWWRAYVDADEATREKLTATIKPHKRKAKRKPKSKATPKEHST
jgi:poly(A) polymerase